MVTKYCGMIFRQQSLKQVLALDILDNFSMWPKRGGRVTISIRNHHIEPIIERKLALRNE